MEFELLKKLVSIPSHFGNEERISRFLESFLEEHGFNVETVEVEGFGNDVIARLPGTGPTVVLNGHMDTVGLAEGWIRSPWGELDGDRFYGLGSADMKAGLAALLAAFVELGELSRDERPNLILTVVSDEEGYSRGTWELIKSGRLEEADLVLVGEPTNEALMLGARGRFVIRVETFGKKAHAARPELGVNAVEELGRLVGNLRRVHLRRHGKLGRGSYCALHFEGSADGLSVPDRAMAILDRHVVVGESWEGVVEELMNLAGKLGLKVDLKVSRFPRPTPEMLPYAVRENNHFVNLFRKVYDRLFGVEPDVTYGRSVGDFNYFAAYLNRPTLVYGPVGGNWHSANEWVSVRSLRKVKRFYVEYLKALAE